MDGVSAAGGALAAVSLALQLVDGCTKLYNFWNSIQNAPGEVVVILEDLDHLSHVLQGVSRNGHLSPAVALGLKFCQSRISTLNGIVGEFEKDLLSSKHKDRFWGSFKAVTKKKQLKLFRESLADTKSTLLLALMQQSLQHMNLTLDGARIRQYTPPLIGHLGPQQEVSKATRGEYETRQASSFGSTQPHILSVEHRNQIMQRKIKASTKMPNTIYESLLKQSFKQALTDMFESGTVERLLSETAGRVNAFETQYSGRYAPENIEIRRRRGITTDSDKRTTSDKTGPSNSQPHSRRSIAYRQLSSMGVLFGKICIRKTVINIEPGARASNGNFEIITTFIFYPANLLTRTGFCYGIEANLHHSFHGLSFHLKTVQVVPDNSLIFDLCEIGDLIGVRRLLERRDASVHDRNSRGWTPLHVAAAHGHHRLCKALIDMGADKTALALEGPEDDALSPITIFAASAQEVQADEKIEMLRLFADCFDLSDANSDGWTVLSYLAQSYNKEKVPIINNSVLWMTRLTSAETIVAMGPKIVWHAVQYVIRAFIEHERYNQFVQKLLNIQKSNSSVSIPHLNAVTYWLVLRASQHELLPMVVEVGNILRLQGFDSESNDLNPRQFTRTLPIIYAGWTRKLPESIGNLEHLIALEFDELREKLRWTHESVLQAITKRGNDDQEPPHSHCSECNLDHRRLGGGLVEPGWIGFNECRRTSHRFNCKCKEFLTHIEPVSKPPDMNGPHDNWNEQTYEECGPDPNEPIFDLSEKEIRCRKSDRVNNPFRDAATLLYQVQGRTWQGAYKSYEVLCSTCFLKRELYIEKDGVGTTSAYPPIPTSYESFYSTISATI